jgi:hypothetical protein
MSFLHWQLADLKIDEMLVIKKQNKAEDKNKDYK